MSSRSRGDSSQRDDPGFMYSRIIRSVFSRTDFSLKNSSRVSRLRTSLSRRERLRRRRDTFMAGMRVA